VLAHDFQVVSLPYFGYSSDAIFTWNDVGVDVFNGHRYWVFATGDPGDFWNNNSTGARGRVDLSSGYYNNYNLPAFDVIGTAIAAPEPSTWVMTLLGFAGVAGAAQRYLRGEAVAS